MRILGKDIRKNYFAGLITIFSCFTVSYAQTFPCDGKLYFFQDDGTGKCRLSYIDKYTTTPAITVVCNNIPYTTNHNAMGANPKDGYLYYLDGKFLKRLDANCNITPQCTLGSGSPIGGFDYLGRYWTVNSSSQLLAYDINTCTVVKGPFAAPYSGSGKDDIVFDVYNCKFYFGDDNNVKEVDTNGVVLATYSPGFSVSGAYGGLAMGIDGKVYGITNNTPGNLISYNTATQVSTNVFSFSPGVTSNTNGGTDMASFPCNSVNAMFSYTPPTGCATPVSVTFTDQSTGWVTGWNWDFGDGSTSTSQNPTHSFTSAGTFTVKLTVSTTSTCFTALPSTLTSTFTIGGAAITTATSSTNASCGGSNGTATVTATGTGVLKYSWSPGGQTTATATGLSAGTYTVTVTDGNGCNKNASVSVSNSSVPVISISSQSNILCNGTSTGSVTVSGSGGTGALTYLWSPGGQTTTTISGLSAGSYTCTVTDGNGCTKQQTVTITQPVPALGSSISSQNNVGCTGSATGSATVTGTGGTPAYTYLWSPGGKTTSGVSGLTAGSYNVTITDNNGCTKQQTVTITQPASGLGSSISSQSNVGCTGSATGSALVTGTGGTPAYTYSWSPGGNTTPGVSGLTAGSYSVTITDNNGCTKQQTVTITQPASGINITSGSTNATCGASNGTASITASGGTGSLTYLWSPSGQTTTTANGLSAGSYNVTVTDGNGCTKNTLVSVNSAGGPTATLSAQTNVLCSGGATGSATVTGSGGTGTLTYLWSPIGGTGTTATGLTAGTYVCTVTDANGCAQGKSVTITQPASGLGSTISSQSNVNCTGSATGSATVTGTGGTPAYTYLWSPGGNTTASVSGLTSGAYNITITDANGCTKQQTVAITQPASGLGSNISSQSNVACTGGATGSATVTGTGGTPAYTYSWNNGQTTTTVTGLTSGTYSVTITDNNGCTKQQTVAITQPASGLGSNISSQSDVACKGGATGSATVTGTGGTPAYTYNWDTGATTAAITALTAGTYSVIITDNNGCTKQQTVIINQPASGINITSGNTSATCGASNGTASITASGGTGSLTYLWSPSGQTTPTANGLSPGNYSVTVTDGNGCTKNASVNIGSASGPTVSLFSQTNILCNGSNTGSATVTASGGTGTLTYSWSPVGGTGVTATGLTAGTYICTVTDSSGCSQGKSVTILQPATALSSSISSQSNVDCKGNATGSATVSATGGIPLYTYSWAPGGNTTATLNGLTAGTYSVTITDDNGCTNAILVTITQPLPFSLIVSSSEVVCAGQSVTLTATPTGGTGPFNFNWSPNGPIVNPLVSTTYKVTGTDSSGCISSPDSIIVTVLPSPVAGFDTLSSGPFDHKYIFTDQSTGSNTWYWMFGDGNISALQNPTHTYPGAGTYTVTQIVRSASGCTDTITKVIIIMPDILIPNVFTPNGDGINDEFWIPNTGFESFELEIYNRWGLKLFATNSGEIRWDGRTSAGVEVPDGTYYFILKAVLKNETIGKNYDTKGFIDLQRSGSK